MPSLAVVVAVGVAVVTLAAQLLVVRPRLSRRSEAVLAGPAVSEDQTEREAMTKKNVQVRRIYEEPTPADGTRVLVDRIWPRGMTKARAHLDQWCKEIAPSTELRKWYHHDPARFEEFTRRYREELTDSQRAAALKDLRNLAKHDTLTLLTATTDVNRSEAAVLADLVRGHSAAHNTTRA